MVSQYHGCSSLADAAMIGDGMLMVGCRSSRVLVAIGYYNGVGMAFEGLRIYSARLMIDRYSRLQTIGGVEGCTFIDLGGSQSPGHILVGARFKLSIIPLELRPLQLHRT